MNLFRSLFKREKWSVVFTIILFSAAAAAVSGFEAPALRLLLFDFSAEDIGHLRLGGGGRDTSVELLGGNQIVDHLLPLARRE